MFQAIVSHIQKTGIQAEMWAVNIMLMCCLVEMKATGLNVHPCYVIAKKLSSLCSGPEILWEIKLEESELVCLFDGDFKT